MYLTESFQNPSLKKETLSEKGLSANLTVIV